jgi:hypothetical protein
MDDAVSAAEPLVGRKEAPITVEDGKGERIEHVAKIAL